MSVDMSQFHGVFFEESHEHLREMEQLLLEFSIQEPDQEALNSIFRAAHSIKGGSGIFGFDALTGLTHVMENILDKARNFELPLTKSIVDLLLVTADQLSSILEAYQSESDIDWAGIEQGIQKLEAINPSANGGIEEEQGFGFFESTDGANDDQDFGFFDELPDKPTSSLEDDEEDAFGFFEPLAPAVESSKDTDIQTANIELKTQPPAPTATKKKSSLK